MPPEHKLVAEYESRCEGCERMIYEGDEIVQTEDGDYVHQQCAEDMAQEDEHYG